MHFGIYYHITLYLVFYIYFILYVIITILPCNWVLSIFTIISLLFLGSYFFLFLLTNLNVC